MGSRLLVPYINYPDPLINTAIININNMAATECKNSIYPLGFQSLGNKMAARNYTLIPTFLS